MATVRWRLKGKYIKSCNCDPGCPCEFWARPTHTTCEGMLAMHVDEGNYDQTGLKGVRWAVQYHWPGPLHEGHGTVLPILDERSSPAQRNAILTIVGGQAGGGWFALVASLVSRVLEPRVGRIEFRLDLKKRTGRVVVPGLLETTVEPIRNLATGDVHVVDTVLPKGMEYTRGIVCQAANKGLGPIAYDIARGHTSLAYVEQTHAGLKKG
ncbi:MAG: DUF1326 domain-containing protein [Candidatus Rokubacteria bacterium]|nr:DUF1326 domain-containing protein [Candidatus Rokubacteria bacterium]